MRVLKAEVIALSIASIIVIVLFFKIQFIFRIGSIVWKKTDKATKEKYLMF